MRRKRELNTIFTPKKIETNISRLSTRISLITASKFASRKKMDSKNTLISMKRVRKIMKNKLKAIGLFILECWSDLCH